MTYKERPESLEGRWDILYRDYPEVYEEWGRIPKVPDFLEVLVARFPLQGKTLVDVGSGTGISTFGLAKHADFVIGIEVEEAMISLAREGAKERGVENVRFQLGDAEHLPLEDSSVDAAMAITLAGCDSRRAAADMERVVRPGGLVLFFDVAPGWYGGELEPVITAKMVAGKIVLNPADAPVEFTMRELDGRLYLFAANKSDRAQNVRFSGSVLAGRKVKVLYENHSAAIAGETLADTFGSFAARVYRLE